MPELSQSTLGLVRQGLEGLLPDSALTPYDIRQFWKRRLFDFGFPEAFTKVASSAYNFDWAEIIPDLFTGKFGDKNSYFAGVLPEYFSESIIKKLIALVFAHSKNSNLLNKLRQSLAADGFDISTSAKEETALSPELEAGPDSAEKRPLDTQMTTIAIFISHSNQDKPIADALTELLRNALPIDPLSIRCTSVDGHKLPVGSRTGDRLRQELLGAKSFVALLTPQSLSSTWVLFELGARWGCDRSLAPILAAGLTASQLGGPLPDINALSCDSDHDLHKLIEDVAKMLGVSQNSPTLYTGSLNKLRELSRSLTQQRSHQELRTIDKLKPKPFGDAIYYIRESENIPYCPACYGTKGHEVPLSASQNWEGGIRRQCPACKNFFWEKPISRGENPSPPSGKGWNWS